MPFFVIYCYCFLFGLGGILGLMIFNGIFFFVRKMSSRASRTLYVGNLPADIREREVEDLFYKVILDVLVVV